MEDSFPSRVSSARGVWRNSPQREDGAPGEVAETVFRDDLKVSPKNGRSLFGLWQSLKAQRKTREGEAARREFDAGWKNADVALRVEDL